MKNMMVSNLIFLILWMCFVSAKKIDEDTKDLEKVPKRKGRTLGHIAGKFKNHSNHSVENFMIFLSFKFYVKSIFSDISWCAKKAIWTHLCIFFTFWRLKLTKRTKFTAPKMAKTAVFAILGGVNFVLLVDISLEKVQKFIKIIVQSLHIC